MVNGARSDAMTIAVDTWVMTVERQKSSTGKATVFLEWGKGQKWEKTMHVWLRVSSDRIPTLALQ